MKYRQCFECRKELPFTAGAGVLKCSFCGAVNEPAEPVVAIERVTSRRRSGGRAIDASVLGVVASINLGGGSGEC